MFTQPINQSGLSGFIPVRRQEGGVSNQELDIGQIAEFDIFGRAIPKTTTNIGQIENPQQLAPGLPQGISSLIPVDGGADDSFQGAPEVSFDDISGKASNIAEDISGKVNEFGEDISGKFDAFMDNPIEESLQYAEKGIESIARSTVTSLAKTPVTVPFFGALFDIANQARKGEDPFSKSNLTNTAINFSLGTLTAIVPALALPVMLVKFVYDTFFAPEGPSGEGPGVGSAPGSGVDAATSGLGIGVEGMPGITGPGFDDFDDFGKGPDVSGGIPGSPGFGGFGDTGDIGGPEGSGGPGEGDADDAGDGDADACWVAGTKVLMGDCTYQNIEDLKIGDVVMSFPEDKKTRKWTTELEAKPIISLSVNRSRNIWHLNDTMVTGREWIVKGDGTAALVMWLQEGDTVMGADGEPIDIYRVEAAKGDLASQITYTFETKNNFSYTADNFRTLRGKAVRAPEDWKYAKDIDTGSMQDEYNKKFKTYTS